MESSTRKGFGTVSAARPCRSPPDHARNSFRKGRHVARR
jgi:hypothetical protein